MPAHCVDGICVNSDPGYLGIAIMVLLGFGLGIAMWALGTLFGPKRATPMKQAPFECGNPSYGVEGKRFAVKYYLVAILFLVFDLEVVFLYPWVVHLRDMTQSVGAYAVLVAVPFLTLIVAGLLYEYAKGALQWE